MNKQTEEAKIREIFEKYDVDDNGTIDWDEFRLLVDELKQDVSLKDKAAQFDDADANNSGMISFQEFQQWWKTGKI